MNAFYSEINRSVRTIKAMDEMYKQERVVKRIEIDWGGREQKSDE